MNSGNRRIQSVLLLDFVRSIFSVTGSKRQEADILAQHLIDSNFVGHDSHGVIRVAKYLEWLRLDMVRSNRHARITMESGGHQPVHGFPSSSLSGHRPRGGTPPA